MSEFRTEIILPKNVLDLVPGDMVITLGSCFAQEIGEKLSTSGFKTNILPTGIVFHPAPLFRVLRQVLEGGSPNEESFRQIDGKWISLDYQSLLSADSKDALKLKIKQTYTALRESLERANLLTITLGTSWGYFHKTSGSIVANCHKIPQQEFEKRLSPLSELERLGFSCLEKLRNQFPNLDVLFTVSPVRHWKDGAVQNQRSKARLIELAHRFSESSANCGYFPSYELMMDDLRDYRYYKDDMLHPTPFAVNYIWRKFQEATLSEEVIESCKRIEGLNKRLNHKPRSDNAVDTSSEISEQINAEIRSHQLKT